MLRPLSLAAALIALLPAAVCAQTPAAAPKRPAAPDLVAVEPGEAGPDFLVQGEYAGACGAKWLGAQVIALGDGTFRACFETGGLPGDGWDGTLPAQVEGATREGKTTFAIKGWSAEVRGSQLIGRTPAGEEFALKKVARTSPTMGAKAPEGAIVLFDGTSTKEWQGGRIVEVKQDPSSDAPGYVSHAERALAQGATTKRRFRSFMLHLEFREPFTPYHRGQNRGNSGVYLQQRYEIQILDSLGLRFGETRAVGDVCGEIYRQRVQKVNMSYPPLSWQTFDIDFEAAQFDAAGNKIRDAIVTVRHNGVLVHDHVPLLDKTGHGQKEGPEPGPINLQDHGSPVRFRNIWVIERP